MQKTAKAASPPIMVNISSSQLDIGYPPHAQRALGKVGPFHRPDGGENGVVLARGMPPDQQDGLAWLSKRNGAVSSAVPSAHYTRRDRPTWLSLRWGSLLAI